jgi:hypothetical protein
MFEGIRQNIGEHFLKKEVEGKRRAVVAKNFNDIQKIGIVFNVKDEDDFKRIKQYISFFKEEGIKKVTAIGYYNGKISPHYLRPTLELNFLDKKDLNWYFMPATHEVSTFCDSDFDVLIDVVKGDCLPMKFVLAKAKSRLKIGRFSEENQALYDLMIDANETKDMNYFMEQVNHYLRILNKPKVNEQ